MEFIISEIDTFLEAAYYGMTLAFCYDIIRFIRRIIHHNNIVIGIEDYLFWVICGINTFAFIYRINEGKVRMYIFASMGLGAVLYLKTFSRLLLKKPVRAIRIVLLKVGNLVKKGFNKIYGGEKKKCKEKRK